MYQNLFFGAGAKKIKNLEPEPRKKWLGSATLLLGSTGTVLVHNTKVAESVRPPALGSGSQKPIRLQV